MKFIIIFFTILLSVGAYAIPTNLVYQGQLLDASSAPVENTNVQFLVEIFDTAGSCLVFEEVHSAVDMTGSGGVFSLILGAGTLGGNDPGNGIFDAYDNAGVTLNCGGGGTVISADGEDRQVRISFDPAGGTSYVAFNNQKVESVPYALYAKSLGGILEVNASGGVDASGPINANGGINFGTPLVIPTCDASTAGMMYWDTSTSKYLACDGTNWVDASTLMGASGGGGGGTGPGLGGGPGGSASGTTGTTFGGATGSGSMPALCANSPLSVTGCAGATSVSIGANTYSLVEIGGMCWTAQNLNESVSLSEAEDTLMDIVYYNRATTEPVTGSTPHGGLYTWGAALGFLGQCGDGSRCGGFYRSQGYCPDGYHIPSRCETLALGAATGGTNGIGAAPAAQLDIGGSSGFEFPLAGRVAFHSGTLFRSQGSFGYFWTSSEGGDARKAWYFQTSGASVTMSDYGFATFNKSYQHSIRCIKN